MRRFEKNETVEVSITDISNEGSGIGKVEGLVVFVPDSVPGDVVSARLTKVKKRYALSELLETVSYSPDRQEPDCPYFKDCGGCLYRDISYEAELRIKENHVREKLSRLAGIEFSDDVVLRPIISMEDNYRYRNKAKLPVSTDGFMTEKGGVIRPVSRPKVGFYSYRTHTVCDVEDCLIQSEASTAAAEALKRYMLEDNIPSFDERWGKGLMKYLTVKTAFDTGEVMVILDIFGKGIPNAQKLVTYLDEYIYDAGYSLESIVVHRENGGKEEYEVLAGKPVIKTEMGGLSFEVSAPAFYQVNPVQAERLFERAIEYADLKGNETVFDLYCGVGTIGLFAAKKAGYVYGIELDQGAVLDANRNAVINGIVNAEFLCGKAEERIEELLKKGGPDVVFVDPPRNGCDERLLQTLTEASPERIVYVSCDPGTLARDIKVLSERGYELKEAAPVDMFPRTNHVETVCLLSNTHKKKESYVTLDVEMDDYYRIKNRKDSTK